VSCEGEVVRVRASGTEEVVVEFRVAGARFRHCCFSADHRFLAAAADSTTYVWDIDSDTHPVQAFSGHIETITSLTFPTSLISSSEDKSVKFWWMV